MNHIMNDSTLRYLKELHKDLSEEEIKLKAKMIWDKYVEDNKKRLEVEKEAKRIMGFLIEVEDDEAYEMAFNRLVILDEKNK